MYRVLARTWRPGHFAELVGQRHVARTLANAIESGRLAHAYLFAGLRGTGKTTVARILAKCLNCEKGPTVTPCGECPPCREIAESRAIDVMEIDAASRTKVEQTRELLEMVSYAPARDRYKILIIDEAHMLSKASFNALLKTLEEPPPNVLFVLATTEIQKILPTILSRCQVFEFRRVAAGELVGHLRRIADAEKITISDAALERVARAGEGSVRDSLSVLERVLAFCGTEVGDEDVMRVVGAVRTRVLADLVTGLARRDAAAMLGVLDGLVDEGHDLLHFWSQLVGALRDLLLLDAMPDRGDLLSRPPEEVAALREAAGDLGREDLTRAFQVVADLEPALKGSSQPRFLFEAVLIRLADLGAVRPIEQVLAALGDGARGETPARPAAARPRSAPPAPQKKNPGEGPPAEGDTVAERFVTAVQQARPMLGAVLLQAGVSVEERQLVVSFPPELEAFKKQCELPDGLTLLREQARRLTGRAVDVTVRLHEPPRPAPATSPAPPPGGGNGETAAATPEARPMRAREAGPAAAPPQRSSPPARERRPRRPRGLSPGLLEQARREPGVRSLLDTFGAQVLEIAPLEPPRAAVEEPGEAPPPAESED